MKTVGAKLDEELHKQVMKKCQGRGCRPSDYIRELVKRDIADPPPQQTPKSDSCKAQPAAQEKAAQVKVRYPRWMPYTLCMKDDCVGLHENENYTIKVAKKCTNFDCEQRVPAYAKRCPMCGGHDFEALDQYDLADIPNPKPQRGPGP